MSSVHQQYISFSCIAVNELTPYWHFAILLVDDSMHPTGRWKWGLVHFYGIIKISWRLDYKWSCRQHLLHWLLHQKEKLFQSPCIQHFKWRRCQCLDALSSSEVEINYSRNVSYLSCQGTAAKTWYMTRKRSFFGTFCFTQEHAVCYLSWVKCGGVQWVLLTFYITEYLPAVKLHFSSSSSASLYNIGRNLQ